MELLTTEIPRQLPVAGVDDLSHVVLVEDPETPKPLN